MEKREISPKVAAMYRAVAELFMEGADINNLTVSEITARAGIGKGTAYEYFSSKEDIIAESLYSAMVEVTELLDNRLAKKQSLYDKIEMIMLDMEKHKQEIVCAFKVLYIMMDNSAVGRKIRQHFYDKRDYDMVLFDLVEKIIREELGQQVQLSEEDSLYLVMSIASRLMIYALYLNGDEACRLSEDSIMRERLCMEICKEVGEYR